MDKKCLRAMIITDSLGCPRAETSVADTWTDKILQKWCDGKIVFYTQCYRGLSALDVDYDHVHWLTPDIIICQIGVVDCSRRVLTRTELRILSKIPIINKIVHRICSKYTYNLTKIRNRHYQSEKQFKEKMQSIIDDNKSEVYFIEIAPASNYMKHKLYNFEADIIRYNDILNNLDYKNGGGVIQAYRDADNIENLFLSDGHHLTQYGTELVYNSVNKIIEDFVSNKGLTNKAI